MSVCFSRAMRREWLGFFALTTWYFSTYQSYAPAVTSGGLYLFWYSVALAAPMIALGMIFGANIEAVSRIARVTAPVGIALTLVMAFLPAPYFVVLFIASAPCIAPLALRCCFGVVTAARPDKTLQTFMSAITASIFAHALWLLTVRTAALPAYIQFFLPALMGALSYAMTRRAPPLLRPPVQTVPFAPSRHIVSVLLVFLTVFVFDLFSDLFHTYFLDIGLSGNVPMYVGSVFLPALSLTLYAVLADRKLEKNAIVLGLSLYLLGLVLALFQRENLVLWPLVFADGIGGAYADFFVVGFSILFFSESGKPVLMASLGLAVDILTASFLWTAERWLPASFLFGGLSGEHITVMAALTILLLVTAILAFDRRSEKTFVISLLRLLFPQKDAPAARDTLPEAAIHTPTAAAAGLLPVEKTVATLFLEGYTRHDIARKLRISSGEVAGFQQSIKEKVAGAAEAQDSENILVDRAVALFGVRTRQAQILRGVLQNLSNAEIAAQFQITERTVKYHVGELLAKTGAKNRRELIERLRGGTE